MFWILLLKKSPTQPTFIRKFLFTLTAKLILLSWCVLLDSFILPFSTRKCSLPVEDTVLCFKNYLLKTVFSETYRSKFILEKCRCLSHPLSAAPSVWVQGGWSEFRKTPGFRICAVHCSGADNPSNVSGSPTPVLKGGVAATPAVCLNFSFRAQHGTTSYRRPMLCAVVKSWDGVCWLLSSSSPSPCGSALPGPSRHHPPAVLRQDSSVCTLHGQL